MDTDGTEFWARNLTLSLASVAGAVRTMVSLTTLGETAGAVDNGVGRRSTATADVREQARTGGTPRRPVEAQADGSTLRLRAGRVGTGAVALAVLLAGADKTVWLSKAREGHGPEFQINLVPVES